MGLERQYKVGNSRLKAEIRSSEGRELQVVQAKGRDPLVSQAKGETCRSFKQTFRVYSPAVALFHKKGPQKKDMCELSLTVFLTKDMNSHLLTTFPLLVLILEKYTKQKLRQNLFHLIAKRSD